MGITLDGNTYDVFQNKYSHTVKKFAEDSRVLTGDLKRNESGKFENRYKITLVCTTTEVANLAISYEKTEVSGAVAQNKLSFTDEESFTWSPTTGIDDATHAYSTGVYFDGSFNPVPLAPTGWSTKNRFTIDIELVAIGKGVSN